MSAHAAALALLDALAGEGAELVFGPEGIELLGEPSEALQRRVDAFFALPLPPEGRLPFDAGELDALLRTARAGSSLYRAMCAQLRARSLPVRELLCLPVACAMLPAYAAVITRKGSDSVYTTSAVIYGRELGRRPLWRWRELDAIARGIEARRVTPRDFDSWLAAKAARRGDWLLTPEAVDVPPGAPAPGITMGELVDVVGAELVSVEEERQAA